VLVTTLDNWLQPWIIPYKPQGAQVVKPRRLASIIVKEFIHIKRDRPSLIIAVLMPIFLLLLFGYAVNTDVENVTSVVLDHSKSQQSRELVANFANSGYFNFMYYVNNRAAIHDLFAQGEAKAALVIPPDYAQQLHRNETPQVLLLIDGSDPTVARTILSAGQLIGRVASLEVTQKFVSGKGIKVEDLPGIDVRSRIWYNPNLESIRFNLPGLIGLILQNITVMLTAFALVRERERGTIEQLVVTPIKPAELIIGKLVPYIIIGFCDFLLVLVVGTYWFRVPIAGSVPLLIGLASIFLVCALAVGIFFSTVARTQLQAMQMALVFIMPSFLLSGFVFPRETMPLVIQWVGAIVPLTYFLKILRALILKGAEFRHLTGDITALTVFTILVIAMATARFRKHLD